MFKLPSGEVNPSELDLDELEKSNEQNSESTVESNDGLLSKFSKSSANDDLTDMNEFDAVVNDSTEEEK